MENILTNGMVEKRNAILMANEAVVEKIRNNWEFYAPTYKSLTQKSAKELLAMANAESDSIKKVLCALAMTEAQPKEELGKE